MSYLISSIEKYKYQLLLLLVCIVGYFQITFFLLIPKWDNINAFLPYRHIVGTWVSNGHLPLWNPYQLLGYPMHADPQSGAWYPITWLLSFINEYDFYAINIDLSLHYFIGGLGMFLLARTLKIKDSIAFIMGMSYMFSGFMVGGSQILVMIIAAAWFPFSINYLLKALKDPTFKNIFILAIINFLSLTGSYPAMTIILFYFYLVIAFIYLYKSYRESYSFKTLLSVYASLSVLVLLLSGAYLLSIYEALPYMTRANAVPYSDKLFGNVAFTYQCFVSFILPFATTAKESFIYTDASMANAYIGIFVLIIMLAGVVVSKERKVIIPFFIAVLFLLISMGMQMPFHYIFYKFVPGFNLFRHPSLFRIYAIFFFIISMGFSLQYFVDHPKKKNALNKALKFSLIFFAVIVLSFVIIIIVGLDYDYALLGDYFKNLFDYSKQVPNNIARYILFQAVIQLILITTAYYFAKKGKLNTKGLVVFIFIDLFLATQLNAHRTIYYPVPFDKFQTYFNSMPEGLTNQTIEDRLIDINNKSVVPKQKAVYNNLNSYAKRTAYDGYNPFKFKGLMDIRESGVMKNIINNPLFYIAEEIYAFPIENIPKNEHGQAFLDDALFSEYANTLPEGELKNLQINFNGFSVEYAISSNGLLFFNQNFNQNWSAYIDDNYANIHHANVGLMAIEVPEGEHKIDLIYNSKKVVIAFIVSVITLISGLIILLFQHAKKVKSITES